MNREHTEKLFNDFPELYKGRFKSIRENLMAFGFECGDGWFDLIYTLSKIISEEAPETTALQVKEKFGGLRFYVDSAPNYIYRIIGEFEECSYKICEYCGKPGEIGGDFWIKTLCNDCRKSK